MDRQELREELARRLRNLLEEEAFDLWDLELASQSGRTVIRVDVDRPSGVNLDDCAYWNKKIGRYLEAEDVMPGSYVLEVGSPGIERTLRRPEHYARYVGSRLEVKLHDPIEGRRTFRGELRAAGADSIVVEDAEAGIVSLPHAAIRKARVVADPWEGMRGKDRHRKGT
ncbi:MAG TPA: ribosome maturation factor RimP [Candidatus Eisenbacteria bacterium]